MLTLVGIIINSFTIALNLGRKTIDLMIDFLHSILPILISLLIASGGYTSAAILHPFILMTVSSIGTLIRDIVLPLVFLSAALQIVNNITDTLKVTRMSAFLKEVCVGLLGVFLSIFVGAVIIQGAGAAVADGISIRTVKFATKNFLPIVGGIFVDALDTVVGCSILLKSALGLFGTIIIFIICIFPILKIISLIFIFKVASAIVEPLGENKVVTCLNDMGNSLVLILVCVASVVMMLFIVITIIVGAGNMIIMMR
ncbi:MAG TPA: stage III sporulation protein AE [Thermoanaerobacterales bacterium]|nr:stage III sporulation protein AE [Thermoanaerobacterales bacterium]